MLSLATHTVRQWWQKSALASRSLSVHSILSRGQLTNRGQLVNNSTTTSKRSFNMWSQQRLERLEQEAEASPGNAIKQASYMKELNKVDPAAVISRYESGRYATNAGVTSEYVSALAFTDRLERSLPKVAQALGSESASASAVKMTPKESFAGPQDGFNPYNPLSAAARTASEAGTASEPVHVVVQERAGGFKSQLWKTVRSLGIALLVISALSAAVEDRGLSKGMNVHSEINPSVQLPQRFADVQGVDEAKHELQEIVEFLRNPGKFTRLGGKLPKGVLLTGSPGTGKTLLARAIAGEAGVPFFYASGSEFEEMFVGVGARRIRELFAAAKKRAPCIIFIDEIDAIGGARNPKDQQYVRMTLNQLLVELDGFQQTNGVIVVGATNFPESLDPALTRPGRFDHHVVVAMPDTRGREQILRVHSKDVPLAADVDLSVVARGTSGFSGADLANLINQAAIKASVDDRKEVTMREMEYAKDKIVMGAERKSASIDAHNRRIVAFHEGGHALVAMYTPGALPVHKATIMPRGQALGMVAQLPEKDELSWTRQQLIARLDVAMGGRVAEEMIFGEQNVTSGASSDIAAATKVAHAMVTKYGMSAKVGHVHHSDEQVAHLSSQSRELIEEEIKGMIEDARKRAENLLRTHSDELNRLATALLEYETLSREEIERVLKGQPPFANQPQTQVGPQIPVTVPTTPTPQPI